jgi:photosystem II stability/assembly factor-like uncharacterized protein
MMSAAPRFVLAAAVVMIASASNAGGVPGAGSPSYIAAIQIDPKRPNVVYASALGGSRGAVIKSTDGGRTWNAADTGLRAPRGHHTPFTGLRVDALAIDPRSPNVLYAGTGLGVYKTSDGAKTWKLASKGIDLRGDPLPHRLIEGTIWALAVDPAQTSRVYAASGGGVDGGGVVMTNNGGGTWTNVLSGHFVVNLAVDPRRPKTVYASDSSDPSMTPLGSIYKSVDGGGTWRATGPPGLRDRSFGRPVVIDRRPPGTVYAGGSRGLFASTNGGGTWSSVLQLSSASNAVHAIALDPSRANVLYVGTTRGIVRSGDGGQTWSAPRLAGRLVSSIAIARTRPQTIYAGVQWRPEPEKWTAGVFASADGGATWRRVF